MLDTAIAFTRYSFIGNEFLTWLWFMIDTHPSFFNTVDKALTSLDIGNRIVLENRDNDNREIITIKGDDAGLEEGFLSLKKGALVIEINLSFKADQQEWTFTLKGNCLGFSALKVPPTGPVANKEDIEGALLEKIYLYDRTFGLIDGVFLFYLKQRVSPQWRNEIVPEMKNWILA
ncbi:MAG TPA: hypothetical protein VK872_18075 [Draconibacterium sp.]|jgi:hypothetical protein|nr:hypothetical protein [Draconibacterium sp.]